MDFTERHRWLWGDAADIPPKDAAQALQDAKRDHCASILAEYGCVNVRVLRQSAQRPVNPEVVPRRVDAPSRCTVPELLARHERVLVVGGRSSGKSALVAHLAVGAAQNALSYRRAFVPFVVPVRLLSEPDLNERTIADLSPIGGIALIREALAQRRALVLVDGLDEAGAGARVLSETTQAFAKAHPGSRVLVTTRPRRTGIPGFARVELPGFVTAALLPPSSSRVYAAHRFLWRRSPERRASLVAAEVDALLRRWARAELPAGSVLGRFDLGERRRLFSTIAFHMHHQGVVEMSAEELSATLRRRLHGLRLVDGERFILDTVDVDEEDIDDEALERAILEMFAGEAPQGALEWGEATERPDPPRLTSAGAPGEGELVQDIEGLIERIIQEIQHRPGLFLERRPGFLTFADLVFQEYLTAQESIRLGLLGELVELRKDPWWHDVIVLAAGAPEVDAAAFVKEILSADRGEAPVATLIAARCAEVASQRLPARLLRTVSRRLSELVPPRNEANVDQLIDVGEVAGPALIHALGSAEPNERAYTANVLGSLHYGPAHGVLIRMASDTTPTDGKIMCQVWTLDLRLKGKPVSYFALAALFNMALTSTAAQRSFEQALERVSPKVLAHLYRVLDLHSLFGTDEPERDPEIVDALLTKMQKVLAEHTRKKGRGRPGRQS